jgi:hypothetical protein
VETGKKYGTRTVNRCHWSILPPDGDTTVTINEETIAKCSRVMARHNVESMSLAIDHAAQLALNEE